MSKFEPDWSDYNQQYFPSRYSDQIPKKVKVTPAKDYTKMDGLFQIKGTDKFGTVLATDSKGMKVFEIKGGGIEVVAADQIEEVFPFTFAISFVNTSPQYANKEYHFLGEAGKFKVGDLLVYQQSVSNIGICTVTQIDTKSRSATKKFTGYKLEATQIH